jgi:uncharacterized protein (DUF2252 family)
MATPVKHPTLAERRETGKAARERTPRSSLEAWHPASDRPDPVGLLEEQNEAREPDLVPLRRGRMMASPFTFYRGAARIMAADLASIPVAGLTVQLCGDAHLSNFGAFASPERVLLFDLNDFDETLPGPFEWDLARLAASFVIAGRSNGFKTSDARATAAAAAASYRTAMAEFADKRTLDVWYSRLDADQVVAQGIAQAGGRNPKFAKQATKNLQKTKMKDSLQALSKLVEVHDGKQRIISDPPVVVPARELAEARGYSIEQVEKMVHGLLRAYRSTLADDRRQLLERFELVDIARKVVGVGSVGTRAWIVLFRGRDNDDPLFLQVKQATTSVLEGHLPKSRFRQPGERVVQGQRLMQAASDIFLGWTKGVEQDVYYYWRQLRDMKGSALVDAFDPDTMNYYAGVCGWTLARAHARSGDPMAIASYLGNSDRFDRSMTVFADRYADRNERDHEAFVAAIRTGGLEALEGI